MRRALTGLAAALLLAAAADVGGAATNDGAPRPVSRVPDAKDTATTSYDVGGVRVIHRRVTANDVVAANLYLLGGTQQITAATAGIEPFLLESSERGTARYPRGTLRARMARLGSVVVIEPTEDWTMIGARSTTDGFDSTFAILADRVMAPTLDSAEVELVRGQYLSAVRQRRDSPDALVEYLADSVAFAGHPYGLTPTGTERSIAALTPTELKRYQREQMVTSRMLLVVVGNVERARVERLVRQTLARLPQGSYRWSPPPPLPAHAAGIVTVSRSLPTNYVLGYFNGPPATSADYQALRVTTAALGGRLFAEVRSRRNLTYAINAPFVERAVSAGGLYVTTVAPDTTLALMRHEVERLKTETVDPDGLERLVAQFITEYFLNNETNSDQATFLARAQLYRGDYRAADTFVDELRKVTPDDVRRVAQRYMTNVAFVYLGDPSKVTVTRAKGF
ncbi:MAG: M16 family metallopeptidase [Gemmatimonadaceae bacterium]